MGRHTDVRPLERTERLDRTRERGPGEIDEVRVHAGDAGMPQQRREFFAVAAPELDHPAAAPQRLPDRARVPLEQPKLGPRDAIPGQMADGVEQRRAERVVEEARGELPRGLLQIEPDVAREIELLLTAVGVGSGDGAGR